MFGLIMDDDGGLPDLYACEECSDEFVEMDLEMCQGCELWYCSDCLDSHDCEERRLY